MCMSAGIRDNNTIRLYVFGVRQHDWTSVNTFRCVIDPPDPPAPPAVQRLVRASRRYTSFGGGAPDDLWLAVADPEGRFYNICDSMSSLRLHDALRTEYCYYGLVGVQYYFASFFFLLYIYCDYFFALGCKDP